MIWVVCESAQVSGADVEQVRGLPRAIGEAWTETRAALDQHHIGRCAAAFQQMGRNRGPAETSADDDDAPAPHPASQEGNFFIACLSRPIVPHARAPCPSNPAWLAHLAGLA